MRRTAADHGRGGHRLALDLRLIHGAWRREEVPGPRGPAVVHLRADHAPGAPDRALDPRWLAHHPGRLAAVGVGGGRLVLAADRLRSWPLLWAVEPGAPGRLVVSDDASTMLGALSRPSLWAPAMDELADCGFVTGGRTLLTGVHQVEQGSVVSIDLATGAVDREDAGFFRYEGANEDDPEAFAERFNAALDAVMNRMLERTRSRRLIVPLSGGLDSRLLVAWLVNHADAVGGRVRTFTYGVPGAREVEVSREVARAAGLKWTAVDYERRPLLEAWHAPATGDFLRACYALSALPHVQDWYALMRLRQRGWLTEGDVVLPGHTIVGNMHDEDRLIGGGRVDQVEVARAIVAHHADLQGRAERAWQDPWTAPPLRRALGLAGFDGGELSVRSAVEGYNFRERQTKYINNSVRAYEFFGLDWDLPMLDAEMWHAWARGSARLTVDRSYYRWLVDRQWQRAVGGTAGMASAYYQVTPVPARARSRIKGVLRCTGTLAGAERIFSAWSSLHSSMGFDALITDTPRPRAALELLAGRKTLGFWTTAFLADTWSRGARLFSGLDVRRP